MKMTFMLKTNLSQKWQSAIFGTIYWENLLPKTQFIGQTKKTKRKKMKLLCNIHLHNHSDRILKTKWMLFETLIVNIQSFFRFTANSFHFLTFFYSVLFFCVLLIFSLVPCNSLDCIKSISQRKSWKNK